MIYLISWAIILIGGTVIAVIGCNSQFLHDYPQSLLINQPNDWKDGHTIHLASLQRVSL